MSDDRVKIVRGFLNNNEFNRIYYTRMSPTDKCCANLLLVHGFGHSVKYLDLAVSLAKQGVAVHLFDLRGFGFSGGQRCNPKVSEIHEDMIMIIKSLNAKLPLFSSLC